MEPGTLMGTVGSRILASSVGMCVALHSVTETRSLQSQGEISIISRHVTLPSQSLHHLAPDSVTSVMVPQVTRPGDRMWLQPIHGCYDVIPPLSTSLLEQLMSGALV